MTHHPIAQIALNGNLKSQENRRLAAVSCEIDYFTRRVLPRVSTLPRFFTGDYLELALAAGAETTVSSDDDLLVLHPWRGVRILRPADYLALP